MKDNIGIDFENALVYNENFNPYTYRNFYNGGGVSIGDINNDGLDDIYFTGNMVSNKLYLNKGNWIFEDITNLAGVACENVWSTGATFVDINADGYLDIYVCKSGPPGGLKRHNELFINNGDLTFREASKEYGLDIEGLSVQAAFFDYDKDGDLDTYILNNSIKSIGNFDLVKNQRDLPDETGSGNKFLRNENGKFIEVTEEVGIYSSKIGFGLGITLGDFNNDDWTDIFISNDFFERDYLYINDQKGNFYEDLEERFESISMGAMGADFADLNNDQQNDLFVTEMLPTSLERQKTKTIFESWDKQQVAKKQGYFNQFSRNTLQRNLGNGLFSEIGRQANVSATEWSWSALLFDMDNDGLRDIFVSNGIYKDLLDRDYLTYEANDETIRHRINSNEKEVIKKLIDAMPSEAVENVVYQNEGNFKFKKKSQEWGLATPSFSNGSAYGDLDNDGDLDLVVNNVNMPSFVYENTIDTLMNRSIIFELEQNDKNINSIGAKITIKYGGNKTSYAENFTSKGFQSSTAHKLHFGVKDAEKVDSVFITFPNGNLKVLTNLRTNKTYLITAEKEDSKVSITSPTNSQFKEYDELFGFKHIENKYVDFNNERLLTQMHSNEGPALASNDVNKDGKIDFYIGGAKGQSGRLMLSNQSGYLEIKEPFILNKNSEDVDALFFDGDNDGDQDLYVCHGGKAFSSYSSDLDDTYYRNDNGKYVRVNKQPIFKNKISSSVVKNADFDNDGDQDLFVGERYKTDLYGLPGSGYILKNDGKGNFTVTESKLFSKLGMITDAQWVDINEDGWQDLIVAGQWMPIKIFINKSGKFTDKSENYNLKNTNGFWSTIEIMDIDNDGDQDLVGGNMGLNNFYESGMRMYIADFDSNGFMEQIICKKVGDKYYPIVDKDELISQIPSLKKKFLYYKDYAKADIEKIFSKEVISNTKFVELNILETTLFEMENDKFIRKPLPSEIQYSPVYIIDYEDIDNDGYVDLFFGGNQYMVKPQFGSYDASRGWAMMGPIDKNQKEPYNMNIKGQIRQLKWIDFNSKKVLVVLRNNEKASFYTYEK